MERLVHEQPPGTAEPRSGPSSTALQGLSYRMPLGDGHKPSLRQGGRPRPQNHGPVRWYFQKLKTYRAKLRLSNPRPKPWTRPASLGD